MSQHEEIKLFNSAGGEQISITVAASPGVDWEFIEHKNPGTSYATLFVDGQAFLGFCLILGKLVVNYEHPRHTGLTCNGHPVRIIDLAAHVPPGSIIYIESAEKVNIIQPAIAT